MQILDNITTTIKDDLKVCIRKDSKLSIAAACFSIYAYQELKKQLSGIRELRFIFTSPTFVTEKTPKAQREFYIPRLSRERSIYGTEFEIRLRNELTQKAIAKECAEWIKKKVIFKSNATQEQIDNALAALDKAADGLKKAGAADEKPAAPGTSGQTAGTAAGAPVTGDASSVQVYAAVMALAAAAVVFAKRKSVH